MTFWHLFIFPHLTCLIANWPETLLIQENWLETELLGGEPGDLWLYVSLGLIVLIIVGETLHCSNGSAQRFEPNFGRELAKSDVPRFDCLQPFLKKLVFCA
jgi:hypothetical protein